jgi:hypothetical protein
MRMGDRSRAGSWEQLTQCKDRLYPAICCWLLAVSGWRRGGWWGADRRASHSHRTHKRVPPQSGRGAPSVKQQAREARGKQLAVAVACCLLLCYMLPVAVAYCMLHVSCAEPQGAISATCVYVYPATACPPTGRHPRPHTST